MLVRYISCVVCVMRGRAAERARVERGVRHAVAARAAALPPPPRAADAVRAPPAAPRRRTRRTALAGHIPQGEPYLHILVPMSFAQ